MKPTNPIQVNHTVHPFSLVIGLVVMAVVFGVQVLAMQPPTPKPATVPADEFSAVRALALAERILAEGAPHPVGTQANAQVRARIGDELAALGLPVEIQSTLGCSTIWPLCGYVDNIITRLPGNTEGPAVLLSAHYDSVSASPGAADDMAGVVAILEIARILRDEAPRQNPIIILLSDGEEPGLLGAEAFVAEHDWADDVGVVVNLEARGTAGQSILFETTENNNWLIDTFIAHAPIPVTSSLYDEIYQLLPANTDLTVYQTAGMAGVNFAFMEELAHYHTPLDNLDNLDPGSVQHHGDNALAMVRAFAELDLADPPPGQIVFQDLWPGMIVQWPEPWTIWIAAACLLVWLALAASLIAKRPHSDIRRGTLPTRALLWGAVVLPLGVVAAALLGLALALAANRLTGAPIPWFAHPLPMRVALWAASLLSLTLAGMAVARRAGFWGLALGVWLWWCLLSLLLAWGVPGASVILLSPTILALIALAAVGFTPLRTSPRAREVAALVALFGASALWLPFALAAEVGLGLELGAIVGVTVGMAASALIPLFALPESHGQLRRWLAVGAALAMLAAFGVALWVPTYAEFRPQRLNLLHLEERHLGQAQWLVEDPMLPYGAPLDVPEPLRQAGGFGEQPATVFPWSDRPYVAAPATPTTAPAPEIHLLADERIDGERVLQLQLRSPRGADQVKLYIPEAAGLTRIDVVETPYTFADIPIANGYQTFACFAPACDGLRLALYLEGDAPFALSIADATPGLPPEGDALLQARPPTAQPSQDGDMTLIVDQLLLGESALP